jgi:hypothetical protein
MSEKQPCYAPVFGASSFWACIFLSIIYVLILVFLLIMLVLAVFGGQSAIREIACIIRQYVYRIRNCTKGNSDPNVVI